MIRDVDPPIALVLVSTTGGTMKIVRDPTVPVGEVQLKDLNGNVVVRMVNVLGAGAG